MELELVPNKIPNINLPNNAQRLPGLSSLEFARGTFATQKEAMGLFWTLDPWSGKLLCLPLDHATPLWIVKSNSWFNFHYFSIIVFSILVIIRVVHLMEQQPAVVHHRRFCSLFEIFKGFKQIDWLPKPFCVIQHAGSFSSRFAASKIFAVYIVNNFSLLDENNPN